MLVIDAATAIPPSTVLTVDFSSPAMMMDPTMAMAEIALVSDIKRRVKQPGDVLDDLEPDERRQHEDEEHGPQVEVLHGPSLAYGGLRGRNRCPGAYRRRWRSANPRYCSQS